MLRERMGKERLLPAHSRHPRASTIDSIAQRAAFFSRQHLQQSGGIQRRGALLVVVEVAPRIIFSGSMDAGLVRFARRSTA